MDVNNVFFNENIDETIYMIEPPRFEVTHKNLACNLDIYDLKQTLG